jgi:hypothetical protein
VVVPRAVWGRDALVGGLAGIASAVEASAWKRGAILDSPYSDTSLGGTPHPRCASWWHPASPLRALVAPRIPDTILGGRMMGHGAP